MRVFCLPIVLAICAGCIIPASLAAIPQDSVKTKLASDSQLQSVLMQARDAVIAETHLQDGYSSEVETDLKRVSRYLLMTGNRTDVLYLQQHSEPDYAEAIRGVLRPANTLEDFAVRTREAEEETDLYRHDEDIELIVAQELERGFLEEALQEVKLMRIPTLQTTVMGDIALVAYKRGDLEKADRLVAAAVDAVTSSAPMPGLILEHQRMLIVLASTWHEAGYENAALSARRQALKLLQAGANSYDSLWRSLGEAAARQGDLKMATETLEHLTDPSARADVQTEMQRAEARMASPAQVLEIVGRLHDDSKYAALREIAGRQVDSGDKAGATHTLQMAMQAAEADDQFHVLKMAEIAWEQIGMGDKSAAEATIAAGLRDNETPRPGSDQIDGWIMLADDLAYMGEYDRALQVTRKIEYADFRARALQLIAYHETQAGHADWAISWAVGVEDPEGRARTFVGIAAGLIERITGKVQDLN